jgi:ubiquitin carboxyl-terminal hydrolase 5/13
MGFSQPAAERACLATNNRGQEEALNWVMEHMDDPDLNSPVAAAAAAPAVASAAADPAAVAQLGDMGFDAAAAALALSETGGSLERAADWLFSRSPEDIAGLLLGARQQAAPGPAAPAALPEYAGSTKMHLRAVVSHVGKTANSGHYVAHVNQAAAGAEPEWVFFNDDKVVLAEEPPLDLGYLLLFERFASAT